MRQKHSTHFFFFHFCVSRQRLIRMRRLMWDGSFAIYPPLLLEYYEAKIQILSVFSWKPALEMMRYVKIRKIIFLIFKSVFLEVNSNSGGKFDKFN